MKEGKAYGFCEYKGTTEEILRELPKIREMGRQPESLVLNLSEMILS